MVRIADFLGLPEAEPFDYQLAMDRLGGYAAPRDKLGRLCASGVICRVKKGLYAPMVGGKAVVDPLVLSGLVYGPSYVSRETALSLHGMIPEGVAEVTCMTTGRDKVFQTPVGRFSYRVMPRAAFPVGVGLAEARGGHYFLAEPEKALCDRIAMVRGAIGVREMGAVVYEDLRIEAGRVTGLRLGMVREIAERYGRRNVRAFCRWLERQGRAR